MIQIQDDNLNQSSAPVSTTPLDPVMASPDPTVASVAQSVATPVAPAVEKNNSAEIDRLLAELDKLSKELDEKPVAKTEPMAKTEPVVESSEPVLEKKLVAEEKPVAEEKAEEKFDFDAFLSDLEKKIDAESTKTKPVVETKPIAEVKPVTDVPAVSTPDSDGESSDEFRKNRLATELKENDEIVEDQSASEDLKSQNIFDMLGLMNISDDEKNQFLDELESMIWDDFVVHDLELLLTSEEYAQARQILDDQIKQDEEKKEALIVYLEKLIPDLDEVLYEKALELKSEMMGERLNKLKENADEASLVKIKEAENAISQNHWKSAVSLLNQLS